MPLLSGSETFTIAILLKIQILTQRSFLCFRGAHVQCFSLKKRRRNKFPKVHRDIFQCCHISFVLRKTIYVQSRCPGIIYPLITDIYTDPISIAGQNISNKLFCFAMFVQCGYSRKRLYMEYKFLLKKPFQLGAYYTTILNSIRLKLIDEELTSNWITSTLAYFIISHGRPPRLLN